MTGNIRGILRSTVIFGLSFYLISLSGEAWARGPGGGGRARPNVSREGPARGGSFQPTQTRESTRRSERPASKPQDRTVPSDQQDVSRDQTDARRVNQRERDPDREVEERRDERRDDRKDYYDDRRDDRRDYYVIRRHYTRGMRYSASWWTRSCSRATIVIVDGYTYYHCDNFWFSRTYYGGDVVYTVTDTPPGY